MAQASSNAQREPSMEEILASIRKIIEDSESTAPEQKETAPTGAEDKATAEDEPFGADSSVVASQTDAEAGGKTTESLGDDATTTADDSKSEDYYSRATAQAAVADEVQPNEAQPGVTRQDDGEKPVDLTESATYETSDMADEVETFREELGEDKAAADTNVTDDDTSMSALNLADIQAEVSRQSDNSETTDDDQSEAPSFDHEETEINEELPAVEAIEDNLVTEQESVENIDSNPADIDSLAELAASIASGTEDFGHDKETESRAVSAAREVTPAARVPASASDDAESTSPPILSEQAGRQVAASFDELSEAFSHNKKFDELAAEMMRPMLQDWLDNNLPVLVEKLVREEIDRVARGASR